VRKMIEKKKRKELEATRVRKRAALRTRSGI
jgi:hypothetical protein